MKTERELFEDLPHIKSRLDDVFFVDEVNTYLPHQWDDADSVNNMHFINGAWYSWQSRVPEGYVVVPKEPSAELVNHGHQVFLSLFNEGCQTSGRSLYFAYKAMLEAVEK